MAFQLLVGVACLLTATGAFAQSDERRLRRPGERVAVQGADAASATDIRARTANRRALGTRIGAAATDAYGRPASNPNRRLNSRVGGRVNARVSRRIGGDGDNGTTYQTSPTRPR